MKSSRKIMALILMLLSRALLFRFPITRERGSGESNVNNHRSELFIRPLTASSNPFVHTSHFKLIFCYLHCSHICNSRHLFSASLFYNNNLFVTSNLVCSVTSDQSRMPDHFVKVTEALTFNDPSQIKGNNNLLTLQPKKNTVLVSHGRPPW